MKTFFDILAVICLLAAAVFIVKGCFLWCQPAGWIALAIVIYAAATIFAEAGEGK